MKRWTFLRHPQFFARGKLNSVYCIKEIMPENVLMMIIMMIKNVTCKIWTNNRHCFNRSPVLITFQHTYSSKFPNILHIKQNYYCLFKWMGSHKPHHKLQISIRKPDAFKLIWSWLSGNYTYKAISLIKGGMLILRSVLCVCLCVCGFNGTLFAWRSIVLCAVNGWQ